MTCTDQLRIYKGRTNVVPVIIGFDVSGDTFTSQIRVDKDPTSTLIAEWVTSFLTDGTDGKLILTLDDSVVSAITRGSGYMDIKRISGGEPLNVFDEPIEVLIKDNVTV